MTHLGFLSGVIFTTFAGSGLFFYKFWRASHDRFFLFFGIACWLIAIERCTAVFNHAGEEAIRTAATEATSWVYLMRLLAFSIILIGIVDKNRRSS
jgi:hypothetical protein